MKIKFKRLPNGEGIELPKYMSANAAGMDLCCAVDFVLYPKEHVLVPTGLTMAIDPGYEVQVRPRSGLAAKRGVTVLNSPGTIDSDFRGEVKVILHNTGIEVVEFFEGDRIAQLVVNRVEQAVIEEVDNLDDTERGHGGFGSTGV